MTRWLASNGGLARVIVAESVSVTGDWVLITAATIEVYRRTESTVAVSLLLMAAFLPGIILGPFAGVAADRFDRRRIMIWADAGNTIALLLALSIADTRFDLVAIYGAVSAVAIISTFDRPASEALLPAVAGVDQLGRANSMMRLGTRLAMVAGPAFGSFLNEAGSFRLVVSVDSLSFLASALLVAGVRYRPTAEGLQDHGESALRAALSGARYAVRSRPIRVVIAAIGLTVLVGHVVNAGTVAFIVEDLDEPAGTYGLLLAAEGLAAVALAIAFTWLGPRLRLLPAGAAALVTIGAATIGFGLSPNLGVALVARAFIGMGVVGFQVAFASYLQQQAADAFRGRVMSLTEIVAGIARVVGLAITGPLVFLLGLRLSFALSGAVIVVSAVPVLGLILAVRRVPAVEPEATGAVALPDTEGSVR